LVKDTIFGVSDRSIAYALNAKTGDTIYETRLGSSASAPPPARAENPPANDDNPPRTGERPPTRPGGEGRPSFGGRPSRRPGGGGGFGGGFGGGGGGSGLYASVIAADGKLYAVTRTGGVYVLAADKEYKVLAHNEFAGDKTRFDATPTIADNRLYLRSEEALYCVGEK
jgi:outer membrane protein assembly factor BamB